MSTAFSDLSTEGKLAKLEQHVAVGHPVPSEWVSWIIREFVPTDAWPSNPTEIVTAFAELDDNDRLHKIARCLHERTIPASWVEWLSSEFIGSKPSPAGGGLRP
nr:hypothetical protein [Neorhizobium tomejilense]